MRVLFLGGSISKGLFEWLKEQGEQGYYTEEKIDAKFVREYKPDIIISYNYKYILKPDVIGIPERGVINLHISFLPWNRGANPNVWSIIENTMKGVTIHFLDEGIDTGDILLQKEVFIDEEKETLRTSYEKLHEEIRELFKINWTKLKTDKIIPKRQPRGGSLHYVKDSHIYEPCIKKKGWDTPIKEFKKCVEETRDARKTL